VEWKKMLRYREKWSQVYLDHNKLVRTKAVSSLLYFMLVVTEKVTPC